MRLTSLTLLPILLSVLSCVSSPPDLTPAQEALVTHILVYKQGELASDKYQVIESLSAADCSGAPAGGRVWGNAEQAIESLKRKAAAAGADAVVNASCTAAPFLNNCWAAQKCSGDAVKLISGTK